MKRILRKNLNRNLRQNRNRARIFGTAVKPRLSVFRSNKYTYAQLIDDSKGHTIASASSRGIKAGKKSDKAKALGASLAEAAKKAGINSAVFNRSFYSFHGRVKAVAEGAKEGGLKI